jgi:hypothetical protein
MSLINDALKQAQKSSPAGAPPRTMPPLTHRPLPPAAGNSPSRIQWLVPLLIVALIGTAIFIIGWKSSQQTDQTVVEAAASMAVSVVTPEAAPAPAPEPASVVVAAETSPANQENLPRLQGIFYSPTKPTAIIEGKTVQPGDRFLQYHVKQINKFTVLLTGPKGESVLLSMH